MKNLTKFFALAIVIMGFSASSFAQVTATATASATIVTPIAISKVLDLNFGNVAVQSTTGGTVILTPAGTRSTGGAGGVTLPASVGTVTAASFTVTGTTGYTFSITLPATPTTVTSGSNNMTVSAFTSTPTAIGTLTSGTQTVLVGATLNVAAGQAAGTYLSAVAFPVTVNYN